MISAWPGPLAGAGQLARRIQSLEVALRCRAGAGCGGAGGGRNIITSGRRTAVSLSPGSRGLSCPASVSLSVNWG